MSLVHSNQRLQLPETLESQLHGYRRYVWTIKIVEAIGGAVFTVIMAFLAVFVLDRLWDTPGWLRVLAFLAALAGCALIPLCWHRWIWRNRRLEHLARLLSRRLPSVGDQLLGIIELVGNEQEQARSRALCEAAIRQVADDAQRRDLTAAAPRSRHRLWAGLALSLVAGAVTLALLFPAATSNAWSRLLAPWRQTPRYTFAAPRPLPQTLIVPHGEPFTVTLHLRDDTQWQPRQGLVRLGTQEPVPGVLNGTRYDFAMPPQIQAAPLSVRIGDWQQVVRVEPTLRPELSSLTAEVTLPEYLERTDKLVQDVRGGAISIVTGSSATLTAVVGRELSAAQVDGEPQSPQQATIVSPPVDIEGPRQIAFEWQDVHGLAGKEPFVLNINAAEDEAPSLVCENLPRQKVVLDSEQLTFRVLAQDDFGLKQIGMQWEGFAGAIPQEPAKGERVLAAGGSDQIALDVGGTFSATSLGIEPQPVRVRIYAEDYFPGRERVYSPTYVFYVLNPEQHAIWITDQLSKWHRQSLEVRDREMQLYETNKQLRDMSPEQLDLPETRRQIENQAAGERANGRRLANLARAGEELVREASRNPEFGVGHLEKWAEMLQILKDIAGNRMPSVADLLKEAAQSESMASAAAGQNAPKAGQVRSSGGGASSTQQKPEDAEEMPVVPRIVDVESTQQPRDPDDAAEPSESKGGQPRLTLPTTTLIGGGAKSESCPAAEKVEEAVAKQQDLLAEFERIANELNAVLANLEGSTLVKRLKAASREQYQIAGRIGEELDAAFGLGTLVGDPSRTTLDELADLERTSSRTVSYIMDDLQAYFERRRLMQFKTVLEEMKELDVVGALRQLGDDLPKEHGLSIAQCEYWSDSLDRWAEDLVDPAAGGS